MSFGPTELIVILAMVLLLFGSTRLPRLARSFGQASREFRHPTSRGRDVKTTRPRAGRRAGATRAAQPSPPDHIDNAGAADEEGRSAMPGAPQVVVDRRALLRKLGGAAVGGAGLAVAARR